MFPDWNKFYIKCDFCGKHYHASEGYCGCLDDVVCACGESAWEKGADDEPRCEECGSGPIPTEDE